MRKAGVVIASVILAMMPGAPAAAQPDRTDPVTPDEDAERLANDLAEALARQQRIRSRVAGLSTDAIEAFNRQDFDEAERLLAELLQLDPGHFVGHYNMACVMCAQGRVEEATHSMTRAVETGFCSLPTLRADPNLAPLRATPFYTTLVANWPAVLAARRAAGRELARNWVTGKTSEIADAALRIDIVSAHDETSTASAHDELQIVADWADATLFPEPPPADETPWVAVILPDDDDFTKWLVLQFGPAARSGVSGIGGAYEHDHKRLIARDLGATLRHEFFHILHWRDMDMRGQVHPVWIQEGLASLVEDMDPPATGSTWSPAPSWRTNQIRNRAERNLLTPVEELTARDANLFTRRNPLAHYAEARALLMYLDHLGLLGEWYRTYTTDADHGYDADRTGVAAIEHATGQELDAFERAYFAWIETGLPEVPEEGDDLDVTTGISLENGSGDGPRVAAFAPGVRRSTGLRLYDIITSLEGRPTRDLQEFIRVLAAYKPGDELNATYRRGRLHGEVTIPIKEQ